MSRYYVEDLAPVDPRAVERTPEGYLRLPAWISRTGVQTYKTSDGQTLRALRHPDDVFEPEALASAGGKPITVDHPLEPVTIDRFAELAVGTTALEVVGDRRTPETQERAVGYVRTVVQVSDARGLKAVADGVRELSCGYSCDWVPESGTWGGEPYNVRQRNIRINHVALVREGRAGATVRLYGLDSAVAVLDAPPPSEEHDMADAAAPKIETLQITRDGLTVTVPAEAGRVVDGWLKLQDKAVADSSSELAKRVKDAATCEEKLQAMTGERDALKAELAKFKADAKGVKDAADASVADAVKARVALLTEAERLTRGSKVTFDDCKSDREIQLKVIASRQPERKVAADAADAYVAGLFEGLSGSVAQDAAPPAGDPKPPVVVGAKMVADARQKYLDDMGKPPEKGTAA